MWNSYYIRAGYFIQRFENEWNSTLLYFWTPLSHIYSLGCPQHGKSYSRRLEVWIVKFELKNFLQIGELLHITLTFTRWGNKKLIHKVHRKNKYLGGSRHKKKSYAVLGISNFNLMFNRLYDYI